MTDEVLTFKVTESVATITLNRPEKKNAFSAEMIDRWAHALRFCAIEDSINVVVLTGAGGAFCSGGDVASMADRASFTALDHKDWLWKKVHLVAKAVADLDKPLIAAVDGVAYGAGMDMALMCDIRFASTRARFCESYINLGVVPGDGGAYFLPRIVGTAKALELLWCGEPIDALEAERIGLVSRVLEPDALMPAVLAFAQKVATKPSAAVQITKRAVHQGLTMNLHASLDMISSHMAVLRTSPQYETAVKTFTERKPNSSDR